MIKVLHIFNHYLPKTENWAYQLISNTPDCKQHIASKVYLENVPGRSVFQFMDNPQSDLEAADQETDWKKNIFKKAYIRTSKIIGRSFAQQLRAYVIENKIQLIHAHFANMGWEVMTAMQDIEIPITVSFYGWDYEMLPNIKPEWKARYQEMFEQIDLILTEGIHGKEILISKGCMEEKVRIQKLGVERDLISFIPREKKKSELRLIQIASFTEKKGQLYSIKAFNQSLSECPNMHLTLIGDNRDEEYRNEAHKYINAHNLENNITFRDFLPYAELNNELAKHQVFIHPSCYAKNKNCEGGAPTVIFNAAGSGMPTIGTTHCDIPSLVVHNETGLLSAEKNIEGLAKSISTFYEMEQSVYNEYANAAHNHIANNYCIEQNAKQLSEYYNMLLKMTA